MLTIVVAGSHKLKMDSPEAYAGMALSVLRRQVGKHPQWVFTFRGEPVCQVNTKAWTVAQQRAGIEDFRWHDLGHTFATWHRHAGTPTHELQRLGG